MKFSASLFFLWILNIHYKTIAAGEFPALTLVHDGRSFDLVDDVTSIKGTPFKVVMLACPMEDKNFNEHAANHVESSLSVLEIRRTQSEIKSDKICKKAISPNILYNEQKTSFMFGYRLHLSDETIKLIYEYLKDVEGTPSEPRKGINEQLLKTDQPNFFWYIVTKVDILLNNAVIGDHRVDTHEYKQRRDEGDCKNYNLGLSLLEDQSVAKIYEKNFQTSVLNQFKKPSPGEIEINEMFLVEQQLTPIDDFDSRNERDATCSYINVRPMWSTVAKGGWKQVEEFVKEAADHGPIEVTSGTYGVLKLPETKNPSEKKEVILNNIVVPEVFWKLVKYYNDNEDRSEYLRKGMLILTYNYISKSVPHTPLCAESICKKSGWEEVVNENYKTGWTYCCSPKEDLLKKLGLEGIASLDDLVIQKTDSSDE